MQDDTLATTEKTTALQQMGREASAIQASFVMAARFPRSDDKAWMKLTKACRRPTFAHKATYRFPRGGGEVTGPSVNLAREAARVWGNLQYGHRVVDVQGDQTTLEGWALDLETNTKVHTAVMFKRLVYRKPRPRDNYPGGWVEPDERDYRELVARNGAVAERNAILKLLPSDMIDDAQEVCAVTMRKTAAGELTEDRDRTMRLLIAAFQAVHVTVDDLERRLGHPLSDIDGDELTRLREIHATIRDGQGKRAEFFARAGSTTDQDTPRRRDGLDGLTDLIKADVMKPPEPDADVSSPEEPPAVDPPCNHETIETTEDGGAVCAVCGQEPPFDNHPASKPAAIKKTASKKNPSRRG